MEATKLPSIEKSLLRKELPSTRLQKRVKARILPKTGMSTMAG
jgi:hypothetical protein